MKTYTLTAQECAAYDSPDEQRCNELLASLRERFGNIAGGAPVQTEVRHLDGYVVEQYSSAAL